MAHYNLGIALRSQGETAAAHKELDELTALKEYGYESQRRNFLSFRELTRFKKQQLDGACVAACRKPLSRVLSSPPVITIFGVTWDRRADVARAREAYQKALELKPDYAQAHSDLRLLFWRLNDNAHALEEFHQAVMSDPDLPEAHYNFGLALSQSGQLDEAARELNEAFISSPGTTTHAFSSARAQSEGRLGRGYQRVSCAGAQAEFRGGS